MPKSWEERKKAARERRKEHLQEAEEEENMKPVERCEGFILITFLIFLIAALSIGISYIRS